MAVIPQVCSYFIQQHRRQTTISQTAEQFLKLWPTKNVFEFNNILNAIFMIL